MVIRQCYWNTRLTGPKFQQLENLRQFSPRLRMLPGYHIDLGVLVRSLCVYTLRPRQDGRHFGRRHFQMHFANENVLISIRISLKFFPEVSIYHKPALVQIMAWCLTCDKPLFEPMMAYFTDAYMLQMASMSQITSVSAYNPVSVSRRERRSAYRHVPWKKRRLFVMLKWISPSYLALTCT